MRSKKRTYWEYGYTYIIRDYQGHNSQVIGVVNQSFNKEGEFYVDNKVIIREHPTLKGLTGFIKTLRLPHQCPKDNYDIIEVDCNSHGTHFVSLS